MAKNKKSKQRKQKDKLKRRRKQILAQQQKDQDVQEKKSDTPKTKIDKKVKLTEQPPNEEQKNNPERKAVIGDIKKVLGIFIIVVIVMVGVGLMIEFTSWLDPAKDWISNLTG